MAHPAAYIHFRTAGRESELWRGFAQVLGETVTFGSHVNAELKIRVRRASSLSRSKRIPGRAVNLLHAQAGRHDAPRRHRAADRRAQSARGAAHARPRRSGRQASPGQHDHRRAAAVPDRDERVGRFVAAPGLAPRQLCVPSSRSHAADCRARPADAAQDALQGHAPRTSARSARGPR